MAVQAYGARSCLPFHHPFAHIAHPFLSWLSRMDTHRAWQEGAACGAISAFYRKLLCVLLCNASLQHTPLHEQHTHVGTRNTDSVRSNQCVVEDFHPYSSNRRCGRSVAGVRHYIRLQPLGMALRGHHPWRNGRLKSHDSAPALAASGMLRIPLGIGSGVYGDIGIIAPENPRKPHPLPLPRREGSDMLCQLQQLSIDIIK